MRQHRVRTGCLVALGFLGLMMAGPSPARGGIVIQTVTVQEVADPRFEYTFHTSLNVGINLVAGNYFTVYDLFLPPTEFLISGDTVTPSNWILSTGVVGLTPSVTPLPTDLPNWMNLTFVYTGPPVSSSVILDLGDFKVTIDQPTPHTSVEWASSTGTGGNGQGVSGKVMVTQVPEPATALSVIGGIASIVVVGAARRRDTKAR